MRQVGLEKFPLPGGPLSKIWGLRLIANNVGARILLLVWVSFLVGMAAIVLFYADHQKSSILDQNERAMELLARSVTGAIESVMLSGYVDTAQEMAERLLAVPGVVDFHVLRSDGQAAFHDNDTIKAVNRFMGGTELFTPRPVERRESILPTDHPGLRAAVDGNKPVPFYHDDPATGASLLTFIQPIPNGPACQGCHGSDHAVRGLIKLTTSMQRVERDIQVTRDQATGMVLLMAFLILSTMAVIVRRSLSIPITRLSESMALVAAGDLEQQVPVLSSCELGRMATIFNHMSHALTISHAHLQSEKDKLTTIILSAREGIVVSNAQGEVVLVNPAVERLLGKDRDRILREGFLQVLDNPDYLRTFLAEGGHDLPDTMVLNNRVLHVHAATIHATTGETVGSAVLIRDITEERKLEQELRKIATTDALTGLFNRRQFDSALAEEMQRADRYGQVLSLLLFDVDHFKRFNDEHGHDQGDRVLQAIGLEMRDYFRDVDHPCRYGGEEFCAILPSTGLPGARLAAERFRQRIEALEIDGLRVTISIGIAIYPHPIVKSPAEMIKKADDGLYAAKKAGRNRVFVISEFLEALPGK